MVAWIARNIGLRSADGSPSCRPVAARRGGEPSSPMIGHQRRTAHSKHSQKGWGGSKNVDDVPTNPATFSVWKMVAWIDPPTSSTLCRRSSLRAGHVSGRRPNESARKRRGGGEGSECRLRKEVGASFPPPPAVDRRCCASSVVGTIELFSREGRRSGNVPRSLGMQMGEVFHLYGSPE